MMVKLLVISCNEAVNHDTQNDIGILDSSSKVSELDIDLEELLGNRNGSNSQIVEVTYDHYFKRPKTYKGYYLAALIDSIIKSRNFDTTKTVAIFECKDGYRPLMDISKIFTDTKGFIVYKDLDAKNVSNWPDSVSNKFNPFYLVWDDVKKEDQSFMWPYGLTNIKITALKEHFKNIYPDEKEDLVTGFNLFRSHCMKCHSINKIGGSMGPELNIPKNVTEYWKDNDLVAFIKKPGSYRYNSSMPEMTDLTDSDLEHIIEYLKYMQTKKLK